MKEEAGESEPDYFHLFECQQGALPAIHEKQRIPPGRYTCTSEDSTDKCKCHVFADFSPY